jgi:hypothetical protein
MITTTGAINSGSLTTTSTINCGTTPNAVSCGTISCSGYAGIGALSPSYRCHIKMSLNDLAKSFHLDASNIGNVGIGIDDPYTKLHINWKIDS